MLSQRTGGNMYLTPAVLQSMLFSMSAREIIAELPTLEPDEFRLVKAKVDNLARTRRRTIGDSLLEFAGMAEGLPHDMARNHDHYLHGALRRES